MNHEKGNHRPPDRFGADDGMPCVDAQDGWDILLQGTLCRGP